MPKDEAWSNDCDSALMPLVIRANLHELAGAGVGLFNERYIGLVAMTVRSVITLFIFFKFIHETNS